MAASKGSQWSPHGARVYLARRPTSKPGSRHIVESAARPLRRCKKEGNGRLGRVGNKGTLRARPHATRMMREVFASKHSPSGARRYEGWQATHACFFTPKYCQYLPLCDDAVRRDEAPHHPPPVALAMASITSSASAVLGGRSRSQCSRPASIAKISVEAIKSLKPKIADVARITVVLRYTASSIHLPLWSSPFL